MADEHADWTPYQKMEAGILKDISHDTDTILDKMEEKDMGGFDSGMLTGLMANKGIDPGIVALLNDRCRDGNWGFGGDGGMLTLLFLVLLLGGRGGLGFGANLDAAGVAGVDRTVVNESNFNQLMGAIGGNRDAIGQLAQTLNCDIGQIKSALASVDKEIAVSNGSIINAIQSCCCNVRTDIMASQNALQSQIAKCCCDTNLNIERQGCDIKREIQETRFLVQTTDAATRQLIQECCCDLKSEMKDGFTAIQLREDQREIQALRDKVQTQKEDANTQAILTAIANMAKN